jgi:large subunit ribosomal protein L21
VFAIIQSGGRQVKVTKGETVTVDRVDVEPGQEVTVEQVLLVGTDGGEVKTGTPTVEGAKVLGVVIAPHRGPKVRIFKKKRRKQYRRTAGHRSALTRVRITEIVG